jgi:hypothetical protein
MYYFVGYVHTRSTYQAGKERKSHDGADGNGGDDGMVMVINGNGNGDAGDDDDG